MSSLQQMKDNVSLEILLIAARKINDIIKVPKMSDFDKTGTTTRSKKSEYEKFCVVNRDCRKHALTVIDGFMGSKIPTTVKKIEKLLQ